MHITWVEISKEAITHNMLQLRSLVAPGVKICACVKGNAYGHGLVESGRLLLEAGADWLSVISFEEAHSLRSAGITAPIYIMGYVASSELERALELGCRLAIYNLETIELLAEIVERRPALTAFLHVKIETGNNRQGVMLKDLAGFAQAINKHAPLLILEGLSTHFANIEDTTDHSYAMKQLENFEAAVKILEDEGIKIPIRHCANSAATILFQKTHFEMVRTGISSYGLWPSNETFVSNVQSGGRQIELKPALTWKAIVAQVRTIPAGEFVGYGCTYKTSRETRMAIVPIGYYDGYDRGLSSSGSYVLIGGQRAPVLGRVCMNIIMVDVTDISEVKLEQEVVLMGNQGEETISAEQFAKWAGTINYEAVTRINDRIPRVII